jgi:phosphonopyruvate decarboxylase
MIEARHFVEAARERGFEWYAGVPCNAVSPLTSLTWTFRLPQLLIVTWRAQPGVPDEPQHARMGPITPKMLETMEIPWELFPSEIDAIGPALDRAITYMDETVRPRTPPVSTAGLASTGFCGREVYAIDDRPSHLYMVGSMGCVVPLVLGLALGLDPTSEWLPWTAMARH